MCVLQPSAPGSGALVVAAEGAGTEAALEEAAPESIQHAFRFRTNNKTSDKVNYEPLCSFYNPPHQGPGRWWSLYRSLRPRQWGLLLKVYNMRSGSGLTTKPVIK